MDPKATLERLVSAIRIDDYATAVEMLDDYYKWRLKGGCEPTAGDERATLLASRLADRLEDLS